MTFEEWKDAYTSAFESMVKYNLNQIGSELHLHKMEKLANEYPDYLVQFENEE